MVGRLTSVAWERLVGGMMDGLVVGHVGSLMD